MAEKYITIKEAYEKTILTGNKDNIAKKTKSYEALLENGYKPTDSVKLLTTDKAAQKLLNKKFVPNRYQGIRQIINAGGGKNVNPFEQVEVRKEANLAGQSSVRKTSLTYAPNTKGYLKSINEVVIELTKKGDPKSLSLKNYIIMQTTAGLRGEQLIQGVKKHSYSVDTATFRNVITKGTAEGTTALANYELGDVHKQVINQQVDLAKKAGWSNGLWHTNTNTMNDQVSNLLKKQFLKNGVKWIYTATGESKPFSVGDLRNQTSRIFYTFSNADKLGRFMGHAPKTIGEKFYAGDGLSKVELQTLGSDTSKIVTSLADDLDNLYKTVYGDLLGHNISDNAKLHGINIQGTSLEDIPIEPKKSIKGKVDQLSGKNISLDIQLEEIDSRLDKTLANIEAKEQAIAERTSSKEPIPEKVESANKKRLKNIFKVIPKAGYAVPFLGPAVIGMLTDSDEYSGGALAKGLNMAAEVPLNLFGLTGKDVGLGTDEERTEYQANKAEYLEGIEEKTTQQQRTRAALNVADTEYQIGEQMQGMMLDETGGNPYTNRPVKGFMEDR